MNPSQNANQVHTDSLSMSERFAVWLTNQIGTMVCAGVFALLACISLPTVIAEHSPLIWIAWITQTFLQLVLLPVIMVGQNMQNKHSEARADQTFQLAQKIDKILEHNGIALTPEKTTFIEPVSLQEHFNTASTVDDLLT